MSQNRKGFVAVLGLALIAVVSIATSYLYFKYRQTQGPTTGAVVYTTQLSDTINTFRNEVNSSTANLNSELETVSGTVNGLGNLSALNSPLPVPNGGTGTSTAPTDSQFLSASGTTPKWKTLVAGSGITIATSSTSTTISTPGFDNTANIAFTGNNTHSGSEQFSSSTSLTTATSGVLSTNASGLISAIQPGANANVLQSNGSVWTTQAHVFKESFATVSALLSSTTMITVVSTTLPIVGTSTFFQVQGMITGLAGINDSSTISLAGQDLTNGNCFIGGGNITAAVLIGTIKMLASTSLELVSMRLEAIANANPTQVPTTCSFDWNVTTAFSTSTELDFQLKAKTTSTVAANLSIMAF